MYVILGKTEESILGEKDVKWRQTDKLHNYFGKQTK